MNLIKRTLQLFSFVIAVVGSVFPSTKAMADVTKLKPIYEYTVKSIEGDMVDLSSYRGKVVVIANTASECGFTPQYEDLEKLYTQYSAQGLVVLGFPSNDFGGQEPGENKQIKEFCKVRYGVTFPLFEKGSVSGDDIQPLFKFLTKEANEDLTGSIKWNFEKFIIDKEGRLVERYGSFTNPMSGKVIKKIEELLGS